MPQVTIEAEVVEDERDNPHNQAGLPNYNPREDPNNAAYEDPNPNVLTGSYIPNSGLMPSVPMAVDDPTSEFYQDPGKSDMLHASPNVVSVTPDGNVHVQQTTVEVAKGERTVEVKSAPDDSVLLAAGNPSVINDPEAEKTAKKASADAVSARKEELDANDLRSREVMANPSKTEEEVKK